MHLPYFYFICLIQQLIGNLCQLLLVAVSNFYRSIFDLLLTVLNYLLSPLTSNSNLADLLQGITISLLTILIPLAIAVLTGFLEKKFKGHNHPNPVTELEISMILDYILNIKLLIIGSLIIFIPTLYWEKSNELFRSVELLIFILGNYIIINRILVVYKWIKSTDFSFHRQYLKSMKNTTEMVKVWKSVWEREGLDAREEALFLDIFADKIDTLLDHANK